MKKGKNPLLMGLNIRITEVHVKQKGGIRTLGPNPLNGIDRKSIPSIFNPFGSGQPRE
jgi:hypothetical protein